MAAAVAIMIPTATNARRTNDTVDLPDRSDRAEEQAPAWG
jgi:hypothetical protein